MKKICVEYIVPGMILAKHVSGLDGTELLPKGRELGEKEKELLQDAGIEYVYVTAKSEQEEEDLLETLAQEYVFKFFMYVNPDNRLFVELYRIIVELVFTALKRGWEPLCEEYIRAKSVERMKDLFLKDMGGPEDIIKHELSLASFPDVYFKLKKLLESPSSSAKDIAEVVSTDVALSTKLLKLVNSPLFGLTQKVDSIERAVSYVGEEELSNLALGITAIRYFKDIPPELIDMQTFWRHSLSCGIFAKLIASNYKDMSDETFFTAGLLHDVGKLILFKNMPYSSVEALVFARENMVPLIEAEEYVLGFTHTDISNLLMSSWEFPETINDIVSNHHTPSDASFNKGAAILQLADNLANAVAIVYGGTFVVPGMEEELFEMLDFPLEKIRPMVFEHNKLLKGLLAALL
ncbi:HDOD domain-containing protein [Desulfothermus okinawensis]